MGAPNRRNASPPQNIAKVYLLRKVKAASFADYLPTATLIAVIFPESWSRGSGLDGWQEKENQADKEVQPWDEFQRKIFRMFATFYSSCQICALRCVSPHLSPLFVGFSPAPR